MIWADPSHDPSEIQRRSRWLATTILLIGALLFVAAAPAGARDLIVNGAFLAGSEEKPRHWQTESWDSNLETSFAWKKSPQGPGVVIVKSRKANDSRWVQEVRVEPQTWYRLSGFVRAVNVSKEGAGASLARMTGFDHSEMLHGTTDWTPVSLWFKTQGERSVKVACRLGGFGQTSSGEAWCTGIRLQRQNAPPQTGRFVYGPRTETTFPLGLPTAIALVLLLAYGIGGSGRLGTAVPAREKLLLAGVLLAILGIKCAAAPFFQYKIDVGTYSAWAMRLVSEGPERFYAPNYFADYPPGYMYVLWAIGSLAHWLEIPAGSPTFVVLLKLPALLADLAVSWLIFARLRPQRKGLAWGSTLAFALNPALLLNSAVWGQTDSVLALLVLLALLAQGALRFELAWIFATLAVLTKPQALLLVPLLALWPADWWKTGRPISCLLAVLATAYAVADPFRGDRPWSWLSDLYVGTTGYYAETSVNAMNLAALLFGMRHNDAEITLGLSANTWGYGIGLTFGLAFLAIYIWKKTRFFHINLFAAASLVSFLCLTRMHERYLYPFFLFVALLGVSGPIGVLYWVLSALFLANQLIVYIYQQTAGAGPDWLWQTVAALNTACLFAWLGLTWRLASADPLTAGAPALNSDDDAWRRSLESEEHPPVDPKLGKAAGSTQGNASPGWLRLEILFLGLLTLLTLGLRLYNIEDPPEKVFDEVYFVDQGRSYSQGGDYILDPHPPFAKIMIGLGIDFAGDNPLGWRIMNALAGTTLVLLMYLLARDLFWRRTAAGIAALLVALDGLCLVDSRIAVIDIHYVTWAVGAYILTIRLIRKRAFQSPGRLLGIGAVLGISVGAKLYIPFFSFLLVLGALAVTGWHEANRRRVPVIGFLMRPINTVGWTAFGVYLLTYAPHYWWGWWHSPIDLVNYIFVEVPNYQSAVAEATHPYSSKWYTWPLMLRPVWYFWQDPGPSPDLVRGIWGAGNPVVWWASVAALLFVGWHAVRQRTAALAFVIAGWILHLIPWVGIGRTLFLYHYLPSLLFAILALAWLLDRLWNGEGSRIERGLAGTVLLASLFPMIAATGEARAWGHGVYIVLLSVYFLLAYSSRVTPRRLGRVSVGTWSAAAGLLSWYFLPLWLGVPLTRQAWDARQWIGQILNWI